MWRPDRLAGALYFVTIGTGSRPLPKKGRRFTSYPRNASRRRGSACRVRSADRRSGELPLGVFLIETLGLLTKLPLTEKCGRINFFVAGFQWSFGLENSEGLFSVSNNSRWQQLRVVMLQLDGLERPEFRSRCVTNGYVSEWDSEWCYHFSDGGYKDIEWFELRGGSLLEPQVFADVVSIQFAGHLYENTLRLYGYLRNGVVADKLTLKR